MTQIKNLLSYLQKMLSNLIDSIVQVRQKQVEAYLARSVDLADLERRMREISKPGIQAPHW